MTLQELHDRKAHLQQSLASLQQSYHVVTGHINEVDFQIQKLTEIAEVIATQVESAVE